ncbi:hypothetical protein OG455_12425 [Kitasatospora sp. NBC_01287]|uniref:TolB family protein n=1 Tax=Kitasatospora sp. NBC_01287 TaxID=2903573 RepID=UPI00225115B9|nr:hypothetical protein [Kitasatospora sp. NBC_01287]MCX4746324.1 hypothetical protein [Kitasatospora sp. NBC_01287]
MFGLGRAKSLTTAGVCAVTVVLAVTGAAPAGAAVPPAVRQVCLAPGGAQPDQAVYPNAISGDGRFALVDSPATNLLPGGGSGPGGVFVCDLRTGRLRQVDLGPGGVQPDSYGHSDAISADGRYVVFTSTADNLGPAATKGVANVYLRDLRTGRTQLVSMGSGALPQSGDSDQAGISPDGRYITYESNRADLVPGDTNQAGDVFVLDRRTGRTARASVATGGAQAAAASLWPAISADGSRVVFVSRDPGLVPTAGAPAPKPSAGQAVSPRRARFYPLYLHDLRTGLTSVASVEPDGSTAAVIRGVLSADGRYAVFTSLDNDFSAPSQVLVRDLDRGTTTVVSTAPDGTVGDQSSTLVGISPDDRWVYFTSDADNLLPGTAPQAFGYFRRDLRTGATERLLQLPGAANTEAESLGASVDGRGSTLLLGAASSTLPTGSSDLASAAFTLRLPRG